MHCIDCIDSQGSTFSSLLDASGEEDGYKALTALGLLSAVQTLVKSAFGRPEILQQMEKTLTNTIAFIFQSGVMGKCSHTISSLCCHKVPL